MLTIDKIGSDMEVFVKDIHTEDITPIIGYLGGTKYDPKEIEPGFFVQEDNVAAEYNIPPCNNKEEFVNNLFKGLNIVEKLVAESDLTISYKETHEFKPYELTDPKALEIGCEPDYNAWTNKINKKVQGHETNIRTCGGHIHISFKEIDQLNTPKTEKFIINFCKALDLFLAVPLLAYESDSNRRQLYGKAGSYRNKVYGFEYRTLSNVFLKDRKLAEFVYDGIFNAYNYCLTTTIDDERIRDIIDNNKKIEATILCEVYKLPIPNEIVYDNK